ncbi:MAG: PaaI family thioesterase [Deltaproteobacteria bacterium]|nr:PaaI family thioesterase [Deltaproteobacteria bacterium]
MIKINRQLEPGEYKITDIFPNIRMSPALIDIFGSKEAAEDILQNNKVHIIDRPYYMFVDDDDGTVYISQNHLQTSPKEILHLDIIHELVHVKQHKDGRELFDRTVSYVDRCTEIEAYAVTVKEARRIGFTEDQIVRYLQVEWITPGEQLRLAKSLNVSIDHASAFVMDYEIYLRRLRSGEPANPFLKFLGTLSDEIKKGFARFRLPIRNDFIQINGTVQDGLISALAVETISHAGMTLLSANERITCVEMKNDFPATVSDGSLIAEARAYKVEGSRISGECIVQSDKDTTICRTEASFLIRN